jgi:hypothetical protein
MLKPILITAGLLAGTTALAEDTAAPVQSPPPAPFVQVSEIVELPEFLPGLGTLFVDPATLPAGPFLGFDRDGMLSATIYMPTMEQLEAGTAYNDLTLGAPEVVATDIYFNAGHPGVEQPHTHVVLYHDAEAKTRLTD